MIAVGRHAVAALTMAALSATWPRRPDTGCTRSCATRWPFTEDGDWLFAPDTHDRGLRLIHVPSGKIFPVLQGDGPFYKAMALAVAASTVAFLRPGSAEGFGPYGIEVWRLEYQARPH